MKKFYLLAWLLLVAAVLIMALTGAINAWALTVFSLVALGLFYALGLWSFFVNTRGNKDRMMGASSKLNFVKEEKL